MPRQARGHRGGVLLFSTPDDRLLMRRIRSNERYSLMW